MISLLLRCANATASTTFVAAATTHVAVVAVATPTTGAAPCACVAVEV